ncbi:stage II sporulation protein M [Desertihabitans brevis]|uniref:Stage II sporulation protein M n=1 Tax=Desertihabitans brevis TaxID=2268447 RepID=A0A367YQD7_9ACTN|nr:stage II sporulation protein M [Desertihabitans brevis]RCK68038.1 stage II sporulation protein M [Desertihabitans brevis]
MRTVRRPLQIIRDHLRPYLVLNAVMYGLLLLGVALGLLFPQLNAARVEGLDTDGTTDLVVSLLTNPPLFALTILAVNVFTVSLASIILPSLVIPFAGIAVFAYRAVTIGITLAPNGSTTWAVLVPHSLTALIEFQAYILLTLGVWVHGWAWLRPSTVHAANRRQGYLRGLRSLGWLALAALALLVLGAVYEALSLRYLVPVLAGV